VCVFTYIKEPTLPRNGGAQVLHGNGARHSRVPTRAAALAVRQQSPSSISKLSPRDPRRRLNEGDIFFRRAPRFAFVEER